MSFSVSGLTTGLDVTSMVSQLMQIERQQGTSLYAGQKKSQSLISTLTTLNGQMKALGDAAKAFAPTSVLDKSAFTQVTAKSSDEAIAKATIGDNAGVGSLTFAVKSIAQAGSSISAATFAGDQELNGGAAFNFTVETGGKATEVKIGPNAKLADVVEAINQQTGGDVKASMVQVAPDTYKLQIASATTGAATNVNVTNGATPPTVPDVLGQFNQLNEGRDTVLMIGGDSANAVEVRSATREVKDVLPGLTINPMAASSDLSKTVTIDLSADVEGIAGKVEAMVKAANDALGTISKNSSWDAEKKTGGAFVGDSTARGITYAIGNAFSGSSSYIPSMAGIEWQKDGTITFDKAKFTAAYTENAEEVTKNVTGLAAKLGEVSKNASNATDGSLTVRLQGEQAQVKEYSGRISNFEDRMTTRQEMYKQQFSALDSMLSKLQSQGSWLQGQLASLPSYS